MTLPARIERKIVRIPFSGCWIWIGAGGRYGYVSIEGKNQRAHRAVYQLAGNSIPAGAELMHTCDVGTCVNPEHLVPGTHQENMADMANKGRARAPMGADHWTVRDADKARRIARENIKNCHRSGEQNSNAKVTVAMTAALRAEHRANPSMTMTKLGEKFGVGRETARKVVKGIAPWTY